MALCLYPSVRSTALAVSFPRRLGRWARHRLGACWAFSESILLAFACAASLAGAAPSAFAQGTGKPQQLPTVTLQAGMFNIRAMVAQSPQEREIGLMYRQELPTFEGMLFVFDQPAQQCFWMKNTPIALDAAFVSDDGTIVNIEGMKPHALDSHCSAKPVRFVLEMNLGWFAKRGLKPGSKLSGPPFGTRP